MTANEHTLNISSGSGTFVSPGVNNLPLTFRQLWKWDVNVTEENLMVCIPCVYAKWLLQFKYRTLNDVASLSLYSTCQFYLECQH